MSSEEGVKLLKHVFTLHDLRKARSDTHILNNERYGFSEDCKYVKLFKHSSIKESIKELLNIENVHLTTLSSHTLYPNKDVRNWHVDWPYHSYGTGPYDTSRLDGCQVIIPLDNFAIENGATMYIPYSHLVYSYPTVDKLTQSSFILNAKEDNEREYPMKKKYMIGEIGDVFIYPSTLWHSSGLNITDTPRRALLANFSPINIPKKDY